MFALPPTEPHFRAQPDAYLSYLFSDATNVSLRAAVKEANLATGVSAWVSDTSATSMLWTVFDLTEHGEENYEQVLEHLYGFLALVRERGVDEQVYKSLGDLAKVHFDYQDPKDSVMSQVSSLASALTQYGPTTSSRAASSSTTRSRTSSRATLSGSSPRTRTWRSFPRASRRPRRRRRPSRRSSRRRRCTSRTRNTTRSPS